jgi:hypothetical protein
MGLRPHHQPKGNIMFGTTEDKIIAVLFAALTVAFCVWVSM